MLAVLFLILPSIIIFVLTSQRNLPAENRNNESGGIHQNGTGSASTEPAPVTAPYGAQAPPDNNSGSASLDVSTGKMTFPFSPESQNSLDDSTIAMIGQFLTSPQNTSESKIAVEIPQLTDEETASMTTVILNAFVKNDVSLSDIVFFVYPPEPGAKTFDINISFK